MGRKTVVYLPGNARLATAAKVMGITMGCVPAWGSSGDARWVDVRDVVIRSPLPEMASIVARGVLATYHFEPEIPHAGRRLLMLDSCAESEKIARALVDFFGGYADFNDCDDTDRDYEQTDRSDLANCPSDDAEWDALQARLWALYEAVQP